MISALFAPQPIAALAALALATACQRAAPEPATASQAPVSVTTTAVAKRAMPRALPLTGSLVANQQADVAANASGKVAKTLVERGDQVKAGAVLILLDARNVSFGDAEARAAMAQAESQKTLALAQCERSEALFRKGAISKDEYDRTDTQCRVAQRLVDAAKARVEMASKTLDDAQIRAPFAGRVNERFVSVGEYVKPDTKVVTLVELSPLRLQMTLAEADLAQVHEGQTVDFSVQAFPKERFSGKLQYLSTTVRNSTRDLVIEAVVLNADGRLRPGMFAEAHLNLPDAELPAVPKTALRQDISSTRLFVRDQDHLEERIVAAGPERDGFVGILDGLKEGELVVAEGLDALHDGMAVQ